MKLGDSVKIRPNLMVYARYGGKMFMPQMQQFVREEPYVIKFAYNNGLFLLEGTEHYCWTREMLIPVPKKEVEVTPEQFVQCLSFTQIDNQCSIVYTKNGQTVTYRKTDIEEVGQFGYMVSSFVEEIFGEQEDPVFDFELFSQGKQYVNCLTEEEAQIFLAWLTGKGVTWSGGSSLLSYTSWDSYGKDTLYEMDAVGISYMSTTGDLGKHLKKHQIIPFKPEMLIGQ